MPSGDQRNRSAIDDEQHAGTRRHHGGPEHRHPAVSVEQAGPTKRPMVIVDTKHGRTRRAHPVRDVVAVDQRDGEPVVGGPLGEGQGTAPSGRSAACAAPTRRARRDGLSAVPPSAFSSPWLGRNERVPRHHDGDHQQRGARTRCHTIGTPRPPSRPPSPAPDDRAELQAAWKRGMMRAAQPVLDLRSLDVHRDVPDADADAVRRTGPPPSPRRIPPRRRRCAATTSPITSRATPSCDHRGRRRGGGPGRRSRAGR